MPRIHSKEPTLNGRAYVIAFADREYLYLRIPRGNKKYTTVSLQTANLKTAHERALDVYTKVVNEPPRSKSRKYGFETAVAKFLEHKQEEVDIGKIKPSSISTYEQRMYQRVIPFAKLKNIQNIGDIKPDSFEQYPIHYRKVSTKGKWKSAATGLAISTINSDISTLREFFDWCVRKQFLDYLKKPHIEKLRDRKDYSQESNPAFMPEDWERVKDALKIYVAESADEVQHWHRQWFLNWVFFQYHGGFRCHETRRITIGDISVRKMSDGSLKGIVEVSPSTKTGARTTIMNGHWLNSFKYHLNKGIKLRNAELKNKDSEALLLPKPTKDTLLMSNPFNKNGMQPVTDETIRQKFNLVLSTLDLDKKYTLHSLRATHITHALLKKMRIRVIADNVGNSEAEIERTYYRLNNLLNIEELGFHRKKSSQDDALVVGEE